MSKPRQTFKQICPVCKTENEVNSYKKVTAITPVIAKMECGRCDCRFVLKVERMKHLNRGQVQVTPTLTFISEDGKRFIRAQEILREDQAKKAAQTTP